MPAMETVKVALADTTVPSGGLPPTPGFVTSAVMAVAPDVVPALTKPGPVIVATVLMVELQFATLVRSTVAPVPVVPMAMYCAVWPDAVTVCEAGMMASET